MRSIFNSLLLCLAVLDIIVVIISIWDNSLIKIFNVYSELYLNSFPYIWYPIKEIFEYFNTHHLFHRKKWPLNKIGINEWLEKSKSKRSYSNRIATEYRNVRDYFSHHGPRHREISRSLQTDPLQISREYNLSQVFFLDYFDAKQSNKMLARLDAHCN